MKHTFRLMRVRDTQEEAVFVLSRGDNRAENLGFLLCANIS